MSSPHNLSKRCAAPRAITDGFLAKQRERLNALRGASLSETLTRAVLEEESCKNENESRRCCIIQAGVARRLALSQKTSCERKQARECTGKSVMAAELAWFDVVSDASQQLASGA